MASAADDRREVVREAGRRLASGVGTAVILALVLGGAGFAAYKMGLFEADDLPSRRSVIDARGQAIADATAEAAAVGRLRLISRPGGARVGLCGRETEELTPTVLEAPAGPCEVVFSRQGYVTHRTTVTVREGQQITVRTSLRKARRKAPAARSPSPAQRAPERPPTRGTLQVVSVQVGTVLVQGRKVGSTPRLAINLAPGVYTVEVRFASLGMRRRKRVSIRAGEVTSWNVDPAP